MPTDAPKSSRAQTKKRKQLEEVFSFIKKQRQFAKSDVNHCCQESSPAFITRVLKQLESEETLAPLPGGKETLYGWTTEPTTFPAETWIDKQINGTQITQAPPEERPRERLLSVGAPGLKTSELLAILIRSGRQGESAVQAGQKVANRYYDQLDRLPVAAPLDLKEISSAVSEVAYCQIQAGIELGRRVADSTQDVAPKTKINSTRSAIEFCRLRFSRLANDSKQEEFHIVSLDTKLQPIDSHRITVGTLDASLVHPREVFRPAIRDAASAILLVHNHPSGDPTPSREDRMVTDRLRQSGELLGIQVIDHIVVARDGAVSLAESH